MVVEGVELQAVRGEGQLCAVKTAQHTQRRNDS